MFEKDMNEHCCCHESCGCEKEQEVHECECEKEVNKKEVLFYFHCIYFFS